MRVVRSGLPRSDARALVHVLWCSCDPQIHRSPPIPTCQRVVDRPRQQIRVNCLSSARREVRRPEMNGGLRYVSDFVASRVSCCDQRLAFVCCSNAAGFLACACVPDARAYTDSATVKSQDSGHCLSLPPMSYGSVSAYVINWVDKANVSQWWPTTTELLRLHSRVATLSVDGMHYVRCL